MRKVLEYITVLGLTIVIFYTITKSLKTSLIITGVLFGLELFLSLFHKKSSD